MILLKKRGTMRPTDYFRLFVLCFWLLVRDVDCEKTQTGYVLLVEPASLGVHTDNGDHKRRSEPPIFRTPADVYEPSSMERRQSDNSLPAQEEHTSGSMSSHTHSHHPGAPSANVPKSQAASAVLHSGSITYLFPGGKIHKGTSGAVQVPVHVHHARAKSTGGSSPVQVNQAPLGFGLNDRKSSMYSISSAARPRMQAVKSRSNLMRKALKPADRRTNYPASSSEGKVDTKMSPMWRPRVYSSDEMSETRGYAHSRRLRPGFNKTQAQAGSVKPNLGASIHDSTRQGFGPAASSEGQTNYNFRVNQPSSRPALLPERAIIPVQGKFKPFQRLPANDLPADTNSSGRELAPTFSGTTLPTDLNSTGVPASVVPSVTGELSNESASQLQPEGQDDEAASPNPEGQSESPAEVGDSLEQDESLTTESASPVQPEGQDDEAVALAPNPEDQSETSEVGDSLEQDDSLSTESASPVQPEVQDDEAAYLAPNPEGQSETSEVGDSLEQDESLTTDSASPLQTEGQDDEAAYLAPSPEDQFESSAEVGDSLEQDYLSTESASPLQTEGHYDEAVYPAPNPEDQFESSAEVGDSLEQDNSLSTDSASLLQTEGQYDEAAYQAPNPEDQSESPAEVGDSLEQDYLSTDSASLLQTEGQYDEVASPAPNPEDQSESSAEVGDSLEQDDYLSTESASPLQTEGHYDEVASPAPSPEDQSESPAEVDVSLEQDESPTVSQQTSEKEGKR